MICFQTERWYLTMNTKMKCLNPSPLRTLPCLCLCDPLCVKVLDCSSVSQ